jgi:cytochrome c biogenesis protein CcdA
MSSYFINKQKSLKRRFLLILGAIAFVCFLGLGLMVIFTDKVIGDEYGNWKYAFGGLIIVYSVLRFARLFKKDENDEA